MRHKFRRFTQISVAAGAAMLAGVPAIPQNASPPIARYTMDAGTLSGMAAMGQGGGGVGAAMSMLRGGGSQQAHELILRLGSSRSATGSPDADHFMPEGARLGASVPLETPRRPEGRVPSETGPAELPRGRLLLFWGCGERAGAGQPVVIDFAKLARGEVPPGLYAEGLNLPEDWRVTVENSTTYGDWPNAQTTRRLEGNSSLLGAHRVVSNYAPEISFNLAQDFMPALHPQGRELGSGAISMSWNALPTATGYYAWAIGAGGGNQDMVWWTSSSTRQFGGAMSDWVSPSAARRYVEAGTLMAPSKTECTIPAEAREAAGEMMMTNLYAYGPQVDFAYPPRPDDARTPWRPEWIARVRYRSHSMMIPGMPMMGGMDFGDGDEQADGDGQQPAGKPKCPRGLSGIAQRAAGLCE